MRSFAPSLSRVRVSSLGPVFDSTTLDVCGKPTAALRVTSPPPKPWRGSYRADSGRFLRHHPQERFGAQK